mgnify:CR=1 FL=1
MEKVKSSFSKGELKNFLKNLADHVESGKVRIEIPGYSKGNAEINPEQPIDVFFERDEHERSMNIEIKLEGRRDIES